MTIIIITTGTRISFTVPNDRKHLKQTIFIGVLKFIFLVVNLMTTQDTLVLIDINNYIDKQILCYGCNKIEANKEN